MEKQSQKAEALDSKNKKLDRDNIKLIHELEEKSKDRSLSEDEQLQAKAEAQTLRNQSNIKSNIDSAGKSSKESLKMKLTKIQANNPIKRIKEFGSSATQLILDSAESAGIVRLFFCVGNGALLGEPGAPAQPGAGGRRACPASAGPDCGL